jgi:hypothetical protein
VFPSRSTAFDSPILTISHPPLRSLFLPHVPLGVPLRELLDIIRILSQHTCRHTLLPSPSSTTSFHTGLGFWAHPYGNNDIWVDDPPPLLYPTAEATPEPFAQVTILDWDSRLLDNVTYRDVPQILARLRVLLRFRLTTRRRNEVRTLLGRLQRQLNERPGGLWNCHDHDIVIYWTDPRTGVRGFYVDN